MEAWPWPAAGETPGLFLSPLIAPPRPRESWALGNNTAAYVTRPSQLVAVSCLHGSPVRSPSLGLSLWPTTVPLPD